MYSGLYIMLGQNKSGIELIEALFISFFVHLMCIVHFSTALHCCVVLSDRYGV